MNDERWLAFIRFCAFLLLVVLFINTAVFLRGMGVIR